MTRVAAFVLMVTLVIAVRTTGAQPCPQGKLRLYASLPLQGATQSEAIGLKHGLEMAIAEVGGVVAGYCLDLVVLDGDSPETTIWSPEIEAKNAYTAVGDPDAVVYVGPFSSAASAISMPITNRASMAQVGMSATHRGLTGKGPGTVEGEPWIYRPQGLINYFRLMIPADVQAEAAARWAHRFGAKRVFILHDGETYGRAIAAAFETFGTKIGLEILANQPIDRTQSDHRKLLTRVHASGADLVYMGGRSSTGAPAVLRQMREVGLVAPQVRFLGPGQLFDEAVLERAGCDAALATNMRVTFPGRPPSKLKGTGLKTYEDYVKRFGPSRSGYDLYAVEAGRVIIDAIRRASGELGPARTLTERREAVRKAIAATRSFDGHSGRWSFDRNGDVDYESDELDSTISGYRVVKSHQPLGCAFEFDATIGK